ncbi:hypothetical protein A6U86_33900 [Rhizobium sp. AC27/96]|nr:hypothetical protein A6U86_33900 [Rhizobium sp. AC27/96]TIX93530.1 DUF3422 domain-containing protein [Rhizobium sp. P44RR-XXIV]
MQLDHPLRRQLHNELHSRPSLYFEAPAFVWHEAFYVKASSIQIPEKILALDANRTRDGKSGIAMTPNGKIKWEMHTEFVSATHVVAWDGNPDTHPTPDPLWRELTDLMPGQRIAAVEVFVCPFDNNPAAQQLVDSEDMVASSVGGGDAEVWSTFRMGDNGSTRMILLNRRLNAYRTGRMVRRLLEIENYRMMALLSLPLSQSAFLQCVEYENGLRDIMDLLGLPDRKQDILLADLAKLSASLLHLSITTRERFSATAAYAELVFRRLEELREERIEGHQRIGVFIDRRFRPAIRSCEQADKRVENTAMRIARASELLRTSVQVELEQQNAQLLESMERRVAIQTRLQQAVEGFSIIAISYYALGILKTFFEGIVEIYPSGHWIKSAFPTLIPLIIIVVWLIGRRVRLSLSGRVKSSDN